MKMEKTEREAECWRRVVNFIIYIKIRQLAEMGNRH